MADGYRRRVNTVCVEFIQGAVYSTNADVILPAVLRDTYHVTLADLYGISINGAKRLFVKFASTEAYQRVVDAYQDQRMMVNPGVEVCLRDVSAVYKWIKVQNIPFEMGPEDVRDVFKVFGVIHAVNIGRWAQGLYAGLLEGTYSVKMTLRKPIPSYVMVDCFRTQVYVTYQGQVRTCRLCGQPGHLAAECVRRREDRRRGNVEPAGKSVERKGVVLEDGAMESQPEGRQWSEEVEQAEQEVMQTREERNLTDQRPPQETEEQQEDDHCVVIMWWEAGSVLVGLVVLKHLWKSYVGENEVSSEGRVMVITGCDSGIGYNLALSARAWGWTVVATCVTPDGNGACRLRQAGIHTVALDFTRPDTLTHLMDLLKQLKNNKQELWGLVNNAGLLTYAPCEWQTSTMVSRQIQVNLMGAIVVTRALLPALRTNKGRVVMVSSPAGQVATTNMTVYCATKWGVEGFTQALRRELAPTGVSVVLVRPCNLPNRTGILRNNAAQLREMIKEATEQTLQEYGKTMKETEEAFRQAYESVTQVQDLQDDYLLQCFRCAMMSTRPRATYSAAPLMVRLSLLLFQLLPTSWLDFLIARNFYNIILSLGKNN